jgi:APA family basic amino acid/polyamine antiporter
MFTAKSPEDVIADGEAGEHKLKRALGPWNLIALGIGAIIGAGLFSLTGVAAADNAGPAGRWCWNMRWAPRPSRSAGRPM